MPTLNQIKSHKLEMVMVVCVRYFGGTELGIPGLRKAYDATAQGAIQQSIPARIESIAHLEFYINNVNIDQFLVKTKK